MKNYSNIGPLKLLKEGEREREREREREIILPSQESLKPRRVFSYRFNNQHQN